MNNLIEISPGYFYNKIDGTPYTNRMAVRKSSGYGKEIIFVDEIKQHIRIHQDGYMVVSLCKGKSSFNWHRLVWEYFNGKIPKGMFIDHINNNRLDNRIDNLRIVTPMENTQKTIRGKNNHSGYAGVSFDKITNKWKAQISINSKTVNLGRYETKEKAYQVYLDAKKKHHGDISILPLINEKGVPHVSR